MTDSQTQPIRVVIIGGSGKVSRHLITRLSERGDEAVALFRNPGRTDELAGIGAVPVVLDIETAGIDELAAALAGADAVVFSAGAGGGDARRTRAVDFDGAVKAIAAAEQAGVRRFVMVSSIGAGEEVPHDAEGTMGEYLRAKHDADVVLSTSSLDWTILRPGRLTDGAATGLVTLGDTVPRGQVTRADVAAVVIAIIGEPRSAGATWELMNGDQPIEAAIAGAL